MRRKDREVTGQEEILRIMDSCKVLSLGMSQDDMPYVVPLNFGYEVQADGRTVIFLHCANSGKKLDIVQSNPKVCFEMNCGHKLVTGGTACEYSYDYKSVIGFGTASILNTVPEKSAGLMAIMRQQTGRDEFTFAEKHLAAVTVIKIDVSALTGKIHSTM